MMKVNFGSVEQRLKGTLEEAQEETVRRTLTNIAMDATQWSKRGDNPTTEGVGRGGGVDTGAFITSFSFVVGRGRPRGKSSKGRPRRQNPEMMAAEGFNLLMNDLSKVDLKSSTALTLRNGSPHAKVVEYKHGLFVFDRLKVKYGKRR